MATNFNIYPYQDDFVENAQPKNYHKILFKPGYAVQARELTQSQSIIQDQISLFGNHIFKNHTSVSGGQVTTNFQVRYLKLNPINQNNEDVIASNYLDRVITNQFNSVSAKVLSTIEQTTDSVGNIITPPTLILSYFSGGSFFDGEAVFVSDASLNATVIDQFSQFQPSQGPSSVISIDDGVFYIDGYFVRVFKQTVPINTFSNIPTARIGLSIEESIIDYEDDPSLLDPAFGSSNYQAPGADRYKIYLRLISKSIELDQDETFIEIVRISNGIILKSVVETQYSEIDNYFAKRTYDTNGNFIVNKFKVTTAADENDTEKFFIKLGPGKAYVSGYIVENQSTFSFGCDKARSNNSILQQELFMNYGNYLFIDNLKGGFDTDQFQNVDIHVVKTANTSNVLAYNSTLAATARVSGLKLEFAANTANSLSYVYQSYIVDIQQNNIQFTANGTTANTITLPRYYSSTANAYYGVEVRIDSGEQAIGETNKIISYNGSTKVATLEKSFTRDPEDNCLVSLVFDTADFESLYSGFTANSRALIHSSSKVNGLDSGDVYFENVGDDELIYNFGQSFITPLSIKNTTYYSWMKFANVSVGTPFFVPNPDVAIFDLEDETLTDANAQDNFICVIKDKGASSFANGDIVRLTSANTTITISASSTTATINSNELSGVTVDVYGKVFVLDGNEPNYSFKQKNLVSANVDFVGVFGNSTKVTGKSNTYVDLANSQVYIKNTEFNTTKQSLFVSDVKRIIKIIDTLDANTAPTVSMFSDPNHDVSRYYVFDNGQNDYYYDHASIKLLRNAPLPKGNILVLMSYYEHEGNGYFSVDSYFTNNKTQREPYENIPFYISKKGKSYSLRDSVDFRKTRVNSTTNFELNSFTSKPTGIAIDGTTFKTDYSYYLGRKDSLIIGQDRNFVLVQGVPSLKPVEPNIPDGSMVIAKITLDPYTMRIPGEIVDPTISSVKIDLVTHKRWRMEDITSLESRVQRVEYYTTLNSLEQSATNLQIADEFGNNRFKNGIITDDFSSFKVSDTTLPDYLCSIQPLKKRLFSTHSVENFDLAVKDTLYNFGQLSDAAKQALGYTIDSRGTNSYLSLPYTKVPAAVQPYATQTVNLNPFFFVTQNGNLSLNPPMDQWVSTSRLPTLLIVDPDTNLFLQSNTVNKLSTGDWQTISSTIVGSGVSSKSTDVAAKYNKPNHVADFNTFTNKQLEDFIKVTGLTNAGVLVNGFPITNATRNTIIARLEPYREFGLTYTTTTTNFETTRYNQEKTDVYGNYEAFNGYDKDAEFVTDVSLNPYIRAQQIEFSADNLLANEYVYCFFDGENVTERVRQTNDLIIDYDENNLFFKGDILGYYESSSIRTISRPTITQPGPINQSPTTGTLSNPLNPFKIFGKVINSDLIFQFGGTPKVKLDIVWDIDAERYTNGRNNPYGSDIVSLNLDVNGNFVSVKSKGNINEIKRYSGRVLSKGVNNFVIRKLYQGEESFVANNAFVNVFVNDLLQQFEITGISSTTNNLILYCNNAVNFANTNIVGGVYSLNPDIDVIRTDENGHISGVFYLPGDTFHTGEKPFRIDNRLGGNPGTETTFAEAKFFALSLNQQKQALNWSPDLASSPGTFTRSQNKYYDNTTYKKVVNTIETAETVKPTPSPSPSPTPSPTPSISPSPTPTPSPSISPTPSPTPTPSFTPTPSPTISPTPSPSPTPSATPTPSPSISPTPTPSPSRTPNPTPSPSPTPSPLPPCPGGRQRSISRIFLRELRVNRYSGRMIPRSGRGWTNWLLAADAHFQVYGSTLYYWPVAFNEEVSKIPNVGTNWSPDRAFYAIENYEKSCDIIQVHDPVCQTFIFYANEYPNGCFIKSIRAFFRNKPADHGLPVTCYLLGTTNGYPDGDYLSNAIATLYPKDVKISRTPHILDPSTYTEFEFPVPVYVKPETMYSVMLKTDTNEYTVYTAKLGDFAISSTAKNLPTDADPETPFKISTTPYIGSLFLSQNTITWDSDQNQDLMFSIQRCDFDITKTPTIPFVVPRGLPKRKLVDDSISALNDLSATIAQPSNSMTTANYLADAFNVTTTDLSFSVAPIQYSYRATLNRNGDPQIESATHPISPGKYGTATLEDIYLDDGLGERVLVSDSDTSFTLFARLSSSDPAISPVISEAGVTLYAIQYNINTLGISNNDIIIKNGGTGYGSNPVITVNRTSNTSITAVDTVLQAVVTDGVITGVNVINPGTDYASTPTITISDDYRGGNSNASIVISGETNPYGGNGLYRYITKPVTLEAGFDAGDLRVYFTAYRPLNTNIHVYYKILNRNDTQAFDDSDWQLMTIISGKDTYSKDRQDFYEYVAAPGINNIADNRLVYTSKVTEQQFTNFYQFAIKIVATSPDPTFIPFVKDMRGIALIPIG
jgi:hypothetical protein